ncbi:MAG: hypothetical protein R2847_13230 [Bacteroidia bacterium]
MRIQRGVAAQHQVVGKLFGGTFGGVERPAQCRLTFSVAPSTLALSTSTWRCQRQLQDGAMLCMDMMAQQPVACLILFGRNPEEGRKARHLFGNQYPPLQQIVLQCLKGIFHQVDGCLVIEGKKFPHMGIKTGVGPGAGKGIQKDDGVC